jgi:hypothetical protein
MKQGNGGAGVLRAALGFVTAMVVATAIARSIPSVLAGWGIYLPDRGSWAQPGVFAGVLILCAVLREAVHLAAALGGGFHFQEISLGPVLLSRRQSGRWSMNLSAQDVFSGGTYLRAVPKTPDGLRGSLVLVIAAGPAAVLLVSLLALLALVSVRGAEQLAASVFCATAGDFAARVLPLGMTEGARVFHLLMQTEQGQRMVKALESMMSAEQTGRNESLLDPAEVLEARRQSVEEMEKFPPASQFALVEGRLELARAAFRSGNFQEAAVAIGTVKESLDADPGVPDSMRFSYWALASQTATGLGRLTDALAAREKAMDVADRILAGGPDWEDRVPVSVLQARLQMEGGDYLGAIEGLKATREACPKRGAMTGYVVELLSQEAECELHLRRRDAANELRDAAVEAARVLVEEGGDSPDGTSAMDTLARMAVRLSNEGESVFAAPIFEAAVTALERTAPPGVTARYRTAWAATYYENGKLPEAAAILEPLTDTPLPMHPDLALLRANLLLAEERFAEATSLLNPLIGHAASRQPEEEAHAQSLRSWALFRAGEADAGIADARQACDLLVPAEDESAAPALFTLAVAVGDANGELAEAYLSEALRLIGASGKLSRGAKSARLIDLARFAVQAGKKDWATTIIGSAQEFRQTAAG